MLNVSIDTGQRVKRVLGHGAPNVVAAVERGGLSVSTAEKLAKLDVTGRTRDCQLAEPAHAAVRRGDNEMKDAIVRSKPPDHIG